MSDKQIIAVDLTPLTKNAGIGGARMLAVELVKQFGSEKSNFEYILLTCEDTHEELAGLEASNVHRVCIKGESSETFLSNFQQQVHRFVNFVFPRKIQQKIRI